MSLDPVLARAILSWKVPEGVFRIQVALAVLRGAGGETAPKLNRPIHDGRIDDGPRSGAFDVDLEGEFDDRVARKAPIAENPVGAPCRADVLQGYRRSSRIPGKFRR